MKYMNWSIERVVVVLTPLFAALAGLVTSSVGQLVPGVSLNKTDVTAIFVAGAAAAFGAAHKWLDGRSKFVKVADDVDVFADQVVAKIKANQQIAPALSDIESVLKTHTDQIVQAIGTAVHAPPSVDEVVKQIAEKIVGGPAAVVQAAQETQQTALPTPSNQ